MPEDIPKAIGGSIAGEAANDIGQDAADLVSELARQELERRHPGGVAETSPAIAFPGAISSDELDAQVPRGTVPFEGIKE